MKKLFEAKELAGYYFENCDPFPLIKLTQMQIEESGRSKLKMAELYNYALGCGLVGMNDEAVFEMKGLKDQITSISPKTKGKEYIDFENYYLTKFWICYCANDFEGIKDCFYHLKESVRDSGSLYYIEAMVEYNNAQFEKAKELFLQGIKNIAWNPHSLLLNVLLKYELGEIYQKTKEIELAQEQFKFVVKNGDKLIFTKKAKEKIEKLS